MAYQFLFLFLMDILRNNIEQFITISDEDYHQIRQLFEEKHFRRKDFIFSVNEQVPYLYFIQSGLVKLSYWDKDGKEHIASFALKDWWETDFNAFYNKSRSSCSLQCLEHTIVYCLTLEDYQKLCSSFPYMTSYFLEKSIMGHVANQNRILSLLTLDPREKYERFLHLYPALAQRIPKTIIAAYLGLSRETLSRL